MLVEKIRYIAIAKKDNGLWRLRSFHTQKAMEEWVDTQTAEDDGLTIYVYTSIDDLLENKNRMVFRAESHK